jgi:outer membrane protein OmpA-like peptidoglycan-associated protein
LLVLALLAGGGWYGWTSYEVARTRATARAVIDAAEGVKGFPMILDVGYRGRSLTLSGLAPSAASKNDLMERLQKALPGVEVLEKGLAALPPPPPDVRPQIAAVRRDVDSLEKVMTGNIATMERTVRDGFASLRTTMQHDVGTLEARIAHQTLHRSIDRAIRKLGEAAPDLQVLAALPDTRRRDTGARALDAVMKATAALGERRSSLGDANRGPNADPGLLAPLDATTTQLRGVADSLASIVDGEARGVANRAGGGPRASADAQDAAEALAVAAERVAATAAAAVQATAIRIPPPPPPGYRPSARDLLVAFARSNAVFFGNGDAYRDESAAKKVLDALADHIKETRVLVRIVGYTDERGGVQRNSELGQARADKVARELVERGVPQDMIIAVGRGSIRDISTVVGEQSANRRVEFEVGFEGEVAVRP